MTELTFILSKGEKIIKDADRCQYSGSTVITFTSGFGTTISDGLGVGVLSSKQQKREGSIFDAKSVHVYLTNKRLIFCREKLKLHMFSKATTSIEMPIAEISLNEIKSILSDTKLTHPCINLSVKKNEIENIKFWFLKTMKDNRIAERDDFINKIKKGIK